MPDVLFDDFDNSDDGLDGIEATQESVAVDKGALPAAVPLMGMAAYEQKFMALINENRLPHALIFHGPHGIGKFTFAVKLARTLLAHVQDVQNSVDQGPGLFGPEPANETKLSVFDIPDTHPVATRVMAGAHPDFLVIGNTEGGAEESKSGDILIEQARKVPSFLQLKSSVSGGWRVVIIDNADRLNRNAQNALLKILEEPPPCTLLVLVTHQPGALLPTIRSRAQDIRFYPLNDDDFTKWMSRTGAYVPPESSDLIKNLAQNCPGQAAQLFEIDAVALISQFFNMWDGYPHLNEQLWIDYAEQIAAADNSVFAFLADFWLWWMAGLLRAKTDPVYAGSFYTMLPTNITRTLTEQTALADLLARRDAVAQIFERTQAASLEKRQAILSARMCLMGLI